MSERPILFSAPMVRAILEGRKTQTRRIVKGEMGLTFGMYSFPAKGGGYWLYPNAIREILAECPYGKPGDRLWVRETWSPSYQDGCFGTAFHADMSFVQGKRQHPKGPHFHGKELGPHVRWNPSIHLPRWASRILLEITNVRVQRLQEISPEDAVSEGIASTEFWTPKELDAKPFEEKWWDDHHFWCNYPQIVFERLWSSINGRESWNSNPWVWAITFKRIDAEAGRAKEAIR